MLYIKYAHMHIGSRHDISWCIANFTCTCICIAFCVSMRKSTDVYVHICMCMFVCMHVYLLSVHAINTRTACNDMIKTVRMDTCKCVQVCVQKMHTYIHSYNACIQKHIRAYIHTYQCNTLDSMHLTKIDIVTYTYTYMYMRVCMNVWVYVCVYICVYHLSRM
jgi:hypothetical protein